MIDPNLAANWMTREEVADRLKVAPKTVANWASEEKGPRFAKIGKRCLYRLIDVQAWENAQFPDCTAGAA